VFEQNRSLRSERQREQRLLADQLRLVAVCDDEVASTTSGRAGAALTHSQAACALAPAALYRESLLAEDIAGGREASDGSIRPGTTTIWFSRRRRRG
jgi:hypothetical protein